jgi:hypothetical protein
MVSHQPVHFVLSLFLALATLCLTFGQSPTSFFIPTPASNPAFSRTITKLYIAGGDTPTDLSFATLHQFISLDLAIPWTRNAPAWTQLADGPAQAEFPAAFSSDEQTMFVFHIQGSNSPMQYNVQSNSWQKSVVRFQNAGTAGVGAVTDPRTGLIYLMGGYENKDPTSPWQQVLDIFDPVSQTIRVVHLPNRDIFSVPWYSGNVWSKYKNSILYWGGLNGTTYHTGAVTSRITELFPDSMTWSTLVSCVHGTFILLSYLILLLTKSEVTIRVIVNCIFFSIHSFGFSKTASKGSSPRSERVPLHGSK